MIQKMRIEESFKDLRHNTSESYSTIVRGSVVYGRISITEGKD